MTTAQPAHGPLHWVDGTMPEFDQAVLRIPIVGFLEYCLRGIGQVVFMNSPITGAFILAAAWTHEPYLGFSGTIGVLASTLTALVLGFDRGAIHAGLFGFNGVLVGLALGLFLSPQWDVLVIVWTVVLSAASSILMAALGSVFGGAWGVPPLTLPFNFVTLLFLVSALQLSRGHLGDLVEPGAPAVTGPEVQTALRESASAVGDTDAVAVINAIFRGIGQLFFLNSLLAGVLIIVGIAFCSRIAAGFALVGSAVGMLTGMALGADGVQIYNGLWGFNSFDAALAIAGVFFVLTWRSALLGVLCAIFTAVLFGAIASIFVPWGLPALTLPFCFGTLTFLLLKGASKYFTFVPPADVVTPEEHLRRARREREALSAEGQS
ncbi:urea transporter [Prauserella cavernicola]|uniref:Urea transporter n=1 Tax=Prauserella cavernicola TaxID=2800127 RepID=A0A934QW65_9PSEU|nr:urea transporter [Prauserella cavernicola]MBK1787710.1 urea transporter [Prauserella cavernicola]